MKQVNRNIESGLNESIVSNPKKKAQWSLPYKKRDEEETEGIFGQLEQVSISQVISYVHQQTGFLDNFNHIQPRHAKLSLNIKHAEACLVAAGSNLGLLKMSKIADIKLSALSSTYSNYFHTNSIRDASLQVINEASRLGAYKYFQVRKPEVVHASADGQKFSVRRRNQMARHSSKYFGMDVGVVVYTLLANHFPINAKTFSPHEHESHFLFDLVFNNETDIDPDIISTDMHGVNHINFALMGMFGRQFAPRFTNLPKRFESLLGFKDPKKYDSLFIRPQKKANQNLIISEWNNILKILLSLAMKEATQSIIVHKLSSHKFSDRTKRALWELDSIYRSIYLLDYLDNKELREDVQRSQNRAEAYHRLKRAIASIAGTGKFRGSTGEEIEIWSECARLLTNCVIYYNTDISFTNLEAKRRA